jgi:hypothetical protein
MRMPTFLASLQTIRLVLKEMLRRWYLVVVCVFISVAAVIGFSNLRGPQYTTVMVVTPAESNGNSLSSTLGGGAGLLGLVGGGQSPQFDHFVILLQSESVSEALMKDPHIVKLMFGESIDPQTGLWRKSRSRNIKDGLYGLFGIHRPPGPTVDDMYSILNGMLVVDSDPLNRSKATVTCTASDTMTCRELMLAVAKVAQERMDKISIENARRTMSYLNNLLTTADEVSLKQALTNVMATTEVQEALSSIGQQRAIVLDGPGTPSIPAYPKVIFLVEASILAGLLMGAASAWLVRNVPSKRLPAFGHAAITRPSQVT